MGGTYRVKANLLMGFDVDPGAIRKTAARKNDSVRPLNVDNREFPRSRLNGASSISFHSMMDGQSPTELSNAVI